ncbi:MAG: hypothetical protein ACE145_12805 [Terriglobia bacterium]
MNRHLFASVSLVFSLVVFAPQVQAQGSASAEQREARAYRLTMEKINQYAAATKSLRKLASSDAKACSAISRDDENEGGSLNEQAKRIEAAYPKVIPVLKAQGLTVREFLLLTAVQLQAGLAAHGRSMGVKELAPDVNPENVAFMEQHKKELDAITADLKKVPDPCAQDGDEEDSQ